jgi:hypothetical protein
MTPAATPPPAGLTLEDAMLAEYDPPQSHGEGSDPDEDPTTHLSW